ncbi:MAG: complex I NDUFA9 subunit family protein [Desulfobacca sp.]|uniref:complex I NDUFA9 subunit family protein n=1 Tax=Desulfobacca sp. TaxID=2067990 RepID=UPI00404B7FEA
MEVLVTGGNGFVGQQVLRALLERGHTVRCLLRPGARKNFLRQAGVTTVDGDVTRPETLAAAVAGCAAVVHLVGIIREFPDRGITFERLHVQATAHVVAAAQKAGVGRYLHMSALEAQPAPMAAYHETKLQAEELVKTSGLAYTIFRPSIIYGPGDGFINLLRRQLETLGVVPIIGDGRYRLQPVPVWQVAQGFALALEKPATINRSYDVGGPEAVSMHELIDTLAQVLGKKVWKVHLPVWPLRLAARLLGGFPWFPVTAEQITMLLAGNTCDPRPFYEDFGLTPISLAEGLAAYLQSSF